MTDADKLLIQGRRAEILKDGEFAAQQIALWTMKLEDANDLLVKYDAKLAPPAPVPQAVTEMKLVPPTV